MVRELDGGAASNDALQLPYLRPRHSDDFQKAQDAADYPDLEPELAPGFLIHRAGIVPSHQVYALTRGQSFVRVVGPGYVRLDGGVVISQIIDLRRHLRSMPVKALTRDGIPLETAVTVIFQVKRPADLDETNRLPYPYDRNVLFHVNYLDNFSDGEGTLRWSDRIIRQASSALISELSNYTLDKLYQPEVPGTLPLEEIKQELRRRLENTFEKYGVNIYAVGVTQFKLPAEVQEQRIQFWQASWRQRIQTEMAAGKAEAMRRIKLARARAQIEIIESITDSIEAMGRSGETDLTEIVALRMLEAMDKALADDTVKALVPQYVVSTLNQVNRWLQEGD